MLPHRERRKQRCSLVFHIVQRGDIGRNTTRIAIAISFCVAVVLVSMALGKVFLRVGFFDFNFDVKK